jgi:hypothetical protein
MKTRLAAVAFGLLLGMALPATVAAATSGRPRVSISSDTTSVNGSPVIVHVALSDGAGKPIESALIRLEADVTFMGKARRAIMDEARTDADGKADLSFAPTSSGPTTVTALYSPDGGQVEAQATLQFNVIRPVPGYHAAPVGISAPWAKSYMVLIPFLVVLAAYIFVLTLAVRIRRAGIRIPTQEDVSPKNARQELAT